MSRNEDKLLDRWSFLDFKETSRRDARLAPTWVDDHWRRLQTYMILEAYYSNKAREWFNPDISDDERGAKREYGDCHLIVEQFLSSLLGDQYGYIYPDAIGDEADQGVVAVAETMDEWYRDERMNLKIQDQERTTCKLGDGVWVMGWSKNKGRPSVRVYDPGHFFPVWNDDALDEEFPSKIHIAYQFDKEVSNGKKEPHVRRITYELRSPREDEEDISETTLPWRDGPSEVQCYMSDGVWRVNEKTRTIYDFEESAANWRLKDLPMGIDFIPVVHNTNDYPGDEFWGTSVLAPILQVADDLINNDTDLQAASAKTATPIIAISGAGQLPKNEDGTIRTYGPGTVFDIEDGTLSALSMANALDALLKYDDKLLERLAVSSRVPESLTGRVKPNEVPSGISLWLSFGPHSSTIEQMREVRDWRYQMVNKFAQRFFLLAKKIDQVIDCKMTFGSYLPADKKETLDMVVAGLNAKQNPFSLETAVLMLKEAGFPIEDAIEEVRRIVESDFDGAQALLDATGDVNASRERLGMDPLTIIDEEVDTDPLA